MDDRVGFEPTTYNRVAACRVEPLHHLPVGAPCRIRTYHLWFRRPLLYPNELTAHVLLFSLHRQFLHLRLMTVNSFFKNFLYGGPGGTRILDPQIKSLLLYQLSYGTRLWCVVQESNLQPQV